MYDETTVVALLSLFWYLIKLTGCLEKHGLPHAQNEAVSKWSISVWGRIPSEYWILERKRILTFFKWDNYTQYTGDNLIEVGSRILWRYYDSSVDCHHTEHLLLYTAGGWFTCLKQSLCWQHWITI